MAAAKEIMSQEQFDHFMEKGEYDMSLSLKEAGRYRVNVFQQQGADAGEAFWRGAVSGGIELATEKLSIDNFLEMAKGAGAKTAVKNLLRHPLQFP